MLTIELDDPGSYGRVVRDRRRRGRARGRGQSRRRRRRPSSWRSARSTPAPTPSTPAPLAAALAGLSNDNAQGEYYLPDVFPALREAGHAVAAHLADDLAVTMGVNNRADLAAVEAEARRRILEAHMLAGVTVVDPGSTWIDADVEIAADARIEPGTSLRGATEVGAGAVVGPLTHPDRQRASAPTSPSPTPTWSSARSATAARSAPSPTCAPAPLLDAGAKAGTFVEIKNSRIGEGAKVPAPRLRRRRRGRRRQQPRRRHDHRQLRRFPQEPDGDRRRRPHRR